MILFLTYHKVLPDPHQNPEFYTTGTKTLERQLDLLAGSRIRPISPTELQDWKGRPEPGYVLSFDDGTRDHFENVLPLLDRFQRKAVFFVPTSKLDREGYLSGAELREMSRRGHSIGLHGHDHRRVDEMSEEDIRAQTLLSSEHIERLTGTKPTIFAPPGGFMNERVRQAAMDAGVKVIRTMQWGYNKNPDLTSLCCVPVNRYTTEREFRDVLDFRSRALTYALKEAVKRLLPTSVYVSLRDALMGRVRG